MVSSRREDLAKPGHPPSLIRAFAVGIALLRPLATIEAQSDDSGHTVRLFRLIIVFAWCNCHFKHSIEWFENN